MTDRANRYTSRVNNEYLESLESRHSELFKGNDTYRLDRAGMKPRQRLSKAAIDHLGDNLPERDIAVLKTMQQLRLATTSHLQRLHFHNHANDASGTRVANRVLNRLVDHQLIGRLERRIGGIRAGSAGQVYALRPAGYRLLGVTGRKRFHEPTAHHVRHTLAIAELVVELTAAQRHPPLDHLHVETEPDSWRKTGLDEHGILKPDLHVRVADPGTELSWFVEIDCDTESGPVLARKLTAYDTYWRTGNEQRQHGVFPKTLWVVPDNDRAMFLEEIVNTTPGIEPTLFAITTTNHALTTLTNFTEANQ